MARLATDIATLRAWWADKQGLAGAPRPLSAAAVLERAGWARAVGGVGPYLTLFSRAGITREQADAAVAALEIHELPSARGCTYVVPAADFAIALKVGEEYGEMRTALKLGVTEKEVDRLCVAIEKALGSAAMTPDELRDVVGGSARSLGEAGRKKGLSTTMPLGLGRLQAQGRIRRIAVNGRLDQQRYKYVRWTPSPLAASDWSREELFTELARRYFRWIGPATVAQFQWFSNLGVKAAKAAIAPLKLEAVDGAGELLLHRDELDAFRTFKRPKDPHYVLVSALDALILLRRDLGMLIDPIDAERTVVGDRTETTLGSLTDLPSFGIFDRGRLVGLWEYDPHRQSIVWQAFGPRSAALKAAVARTETFIRDELGDARSFSLDSPKSRAARIEALRAP